MTWLRCDAMIKGWVTAAMEKEIRVSVKYAHFVQEIWNDLQERFGKENAPRAYEVKQLLSNTRQNGVSVSSYYTRLRTLWYEMCSVFSTPMCSCNGCVCDMSKRFSDQKDKEKLYEYLLGLDNEFSTIRTQILAMKPTPTLGEAFRLVSDDEQQRAVSMGKRTSVDSATFQTHVKKGGSASTQKLHTGRNKEKEDVKTLKEVNEHCTFCDKDGHKLEGFFKLVGYPEWWPRKKREKPKSKAACVETEPSPIPGLSNKDYQLFLKHFSGEGKTEGT
ncbi:uncharacterized protein LOC143529176 [Bidens hawaiensis]|uniref:uncharacterized protein LOC143529176 n=1 Tax=Bidens hawaiensis TaxID=980011 RepID=UPI0040493654